MRVWANKKEFNLSQMVLEEKEEEENREKRKLKLEERERERERERVFWVENKGK